jgi:small-conductance mechanosensitive channel
MYQSGAIIMFDRNGNMRHPCLKRKKPYRIFMLFPVFFFIFLFLLAYTVFAADSANQETSPTQNKTTSQTILASPAPIPLDSVATQAIQVSALIQKLNNQLEPSADILKIQQNFSGISSRMMVDQQRTTKDLTAQPTLDTLQNEGNLWQKNQTLMTKWLDLMSQQANQLQSALTQLADLQKTWHLTLNSAKTAKTTKEITQQISAVILSIEDAQKKFEMQHSSTINLQGRIAGKLAQSNTVLSKIAQAQKTVIGSSNRWGLVPIWNVKLWGRAYGHGFSRIHEISINTWLALKPYFSTPSSPISIHFGAFVLLSALFIMLRRKVNQWSTNEIAAFTNVFDRPYTSAFIVMLLIFSSPYLSTPSIVQDLFGVLVVFAMISLTIPTINHRLKKGLYALGVLFLIDMVRHIFAGASLLDQLLIVSESFIGISLMLWTLFYGNLRISSIQAEDSKQLQFFRMVAIIILIILSVGLVSGVLGFVLLARLLVSGIFIGAAMALTLSIIIKLLCGLLAYCLRIWPLNLLNMVRHHRNFLEGRFYRILVWGAIVVWLIRVLDYFGLLQPALLLSKAVFAAKLERGSVSISLEDAFAFILTLWVAYLLSAIIRFVLDEDIYPRTKISRGVGYTASRILSYLILTIGFILGLGVFGIDLTKVTVLLGAFGVGIGFGLQNVVNNFVSGLILLFERPIHVDDTVEVANIRGTIRQIGIRASILRSRQGADIIIPNSQLISDQVTNWTFTDRYHRIELQVGVDYSSPPKKVIAVLSSVASAHPKVLKYPSPKAILTEFSDSSINYELRFWIDDPVHWAWYKSDVAVAVYEAIHEAGMSFPFPQREVRLLNGKDNFEEKG